jgi:hypothetical protein
LTNRDLFLQMARGCRGYRGGPERFGGVRGNDPRPRFGARDEGPPPPRRASGWGVAPPSRHLWVGGLAPGVTASGLLELFLRCGDVEDITRDPGRSFAFVSFLREEDASAAVRELQGARLSGAPVRIEFSKGVSVEHPLFLCTCFMLKLSLVHCASLIIETRTIMFHDKPSTKFRNHSFASLSKLGRNMGISVSCARKAEQKFVPCSWLRRISLMVYLVNPMNI